MEIEFCSTTPRAVTRLHFGRGLLRSSLLSSLCKNHRPIVIADKAVPRTLALETLEVDARTAKTRETKQQLEDTLLQKGYGRDTMIVAYGGGSITDMAGFLAATYLRGVPWIAVPTTVLGMVDASIGGKTAIDTPLAKNAVGAIHHPQHIVVDPDMARSTNFDLAEILKIALVQSAPLWKKTIHDGLTDDVMLEAIRAKIAVVQQDPTETGFRRIVNFGHTVAHALEVVSEYTLSHAEAVLMGTAAESYLSATPQWPEIEQVYKRFDLFLPKQYDRKCFFEAMKQDKKNKDGQVRFVLMEQIGKARSFGGQYCAPVSEKQLEEMTLWLEQRFTRRK
jgi:3-dehydroquinate synthase